MLETTLMAVFITGLFGGLHCAGMCGGIVSALACRAPASRVKLYGRLAHASSVSAGSRGRLAPSPPARLCCSSQLNTQILYNLGRLTTYTSLGAVAGGVGSVGWWMGFALPLQQVAFLFTNVLLIAIGLYLSGIHWVGHFLESFGRGLWQWLYPRALNQLKAPGDFSAIAAGALWGMVPCGMVYAVLLAALFSGSVSQGAALMLAFGLGTLPALLALGTAGVWLKERSRQPAIRRAAGLVIILFGVSGLLRLDGVENLPLIGQLCSRLPSPTLADLFP